MDKRLDSRLPGISPPAWPALLAMISEIDELKGWWRGRFDPPPSYLGAIRRRTVSLSAKSSTGIDWVGFPSEAGGHSIPQVPSGAEALRRASAARYAQLLKAIFDGYPEMPLSRETILDIHEGLRRPSPGDPARRGAYRSLPDRSAFTPRRTAEAIALQPAAPESIPGGMDALIGWTNSRLESSPFHPLLVIAGFVLEFLAIRPFDAGNGRTSRLLTGLLLLRCGYAYLPFASLEKVISERKAEYYLALRRSQASLHLPRPDMGPWFLAFLDAMRIHAREVKGALAPQPREGRLSGNQEGVLELLERHGEVTNRLVAGKLALPRETAKQVLNRLVSLGLLARVGAGRAVRYRKTDPARADGPVQPPSAK
jgi:Fic family protein